MYRDYAGTVSFWSNMSRRQAGIGLIVQKSFINQFKERSWEEIEAGRIAVLRLRGGKGGLDLWVCYFSATSTEERVSSIQTMFFTHKSTGGGYVIRLWGLQFYDT